MNKKKNSKNKESKIIDGIIDTHSYSNNSFYHNLKCKTCDKNSHEFVNPYFKIHYKYRHREVRNYCENYYKMNILLNINICEECLLSFNPFSIKEFLEKLKIKKSVIEHGISIVYEKRFKYCDSIKINWDLSRIYYIEKIPILINPDEIKKYLNSNPKYKKNKFT